MKTTTVTRLKNCLSAYLKEVEAGETLLITDRRKPVAILQRLSAGDGVDMLEKLSARGIVSRGQRPFSVSRFLKQAKGVAGSGLTKAIIDEREER